MLNVCISFDYEIFMGENYVSEEEVLLKPTEKISQMLKELGVSATFFADVYCPEAYRRLGKHEFADAFDEQLRFLVQQGHDVQLHMHPHWKKASQVGARVEFPREAYRIHNWMEDGSDAVVRQMVHDGVNYLNRVILPVKSDYRCLAFRAGGYCLQPEKELVSILYQEGIRIDSSVCQGMAHDGDGMYYDYCTHPKVSNLYLSNSYGLADNMEKRIPEGVFEVPVAGYSTFPFRIIASKLNARISNQKPNGYGMKLEQRQPGLGKRSIIDRVKAAMNATNMVTFDFHNDKSMAYMLKRIAKEERCNKRDVFLSTIAHPKGQSDDHIENMKRVVEKLKNTNSIGFVSMRQIADQLML